MSLQINSDIQKDTLRTPSRRMAASFCPLLSAVMPYSNLLEDKNSYSKIIDMIRIIKYWVYSE
jgi:hypothetical protein